MNEGPLPSPGFGPLGAAPPALCAGTRLQTPDGPVAIESLAVGGRVLAANGSEHVIRWIGCRTLRIDLVPLNQRPSLAPITIGAGALGVDLPPCPLHVSPTLIMHLTRMLSAPPMIAPTPSWEGNVVDYYNVETETPTLLIAEGIAFESYRDRGDSNAFANAVSRAMAVAVDAPQEAPEPIADIDADGLTRDPGLHLVVAGKAVWPSSVSGDLYHFHVPARTAEIRLASRSVVPAEEDPSQGDRRRLGVGIRMMRIRTATLEIEIGPEEEALTDGFHGREPGLRWTEGSALLPPRYYRWIADPCEIEIRILETPLRYRVKPAAAPAIPEVAALVVAAPPPGRRRALVIDACTPTPDRDAGSNVTLWHMRLLQDLGYDVTFVPQDNFTAIPGYTPALHELGITTVEIPAYSRIEPFLRDHGASFDLAYIHRFQVAEACVALLREHAPRSPILFNNADLHYLRLERAAALTGEAADSEHAAEVKRRELAIIAACDVTVLCNTVERDLIARELPEARLHVLPWVIAPRTGPVPPHEARADIMFLGGFGHPPNVDAVKWFVASVLPVLKRLRPQLRLHIYGSAIPPQIEALAADAAIVIGGHVDDLQPVFDRHIATIAPLRYGAGFKGKLAEALAAGIPSVASPIAIEGSGLVGGEHALVAETAPSFAMAIARLEADAALWDRLSRAGLGFVADNLSPARGREHLAEIITMATKTG